MAHVTAKAKVRKNKKTLSRKVADIQEAKGGFIVTTRIDRDDGPYDSGTKHIATTQKKATAIITGFLK